MGHFVPGFFIIAYLEDSHTLKHITMSHSFLQPNNIPYINCCVSILQLIDFDLIPLSCDYAHEYR